MKKKNNPLSPLSIVIPCATVFISSACIMILEIVAGRLIAKYLGATLYVWTSVISVVLGGITIGNFIGGRIADRYPAKKTLAILFGISSAACVFIVFLNNAAGSWTLLWQLPWPVRVLFHVAIVFLLPSALLGTISPVVAKMALDAGYPKGETIGKIYAWGAAGSILGTLLAGFVLIAAIGTIGIIWIIAALLLIIAIAYSLKSWVLYTWAGVFILLLLFGLVDTSWAEGAGVFLGLREKPDSRIIYEDESNYCYISVTQLSKQPDIRMLRQDDLESHSKILMDNIEALQFTYTKMIAAITNTIKKDHSPISVLSIGGGGYVFPRYILSQYPGSIVDVAEIDPAVTEAAIRAFGLSRETTINTINMDGRNYLNELIEKKKLGKEVPVYDLIFGDAFGDSFVPFQVVTKECNDHIYTLLADDGVYVINIIDSYESSAFLGAMIRTMNQTFDFTYVVSAYEPAAVGRNFILIGSKQEIGIEEIQKHEQVRDLSLWILNEEEIERTLIKAKGMTLTDDYAPVEQLLSPMVFVRSRYLFAKKYIEKGDRLFKRDKWRDSITAYEKAIDICPEISIVAFGRMSTVYAELQQWNEIIRMGEQAIAFNEKSGVKIGVSNIHYNIGQLQLQQGKVDEGIEHMYTAIRGFKESLSRAPDNISLYINLGNAYGFTGNFEDAIASFRQALSLDPLDREVRLDLVGAHMKLQQYDKAKQTLEEGIRLLRENGITEGISEFTEFLDNFEEKKNEYL